MVRKLKMLVVSSVCLLFFFPFDNNIEQRKFYTLMCVCFRLYKTPKIHVRLLFYLFIYLFTVGISGHYKVVMQRKKPWFLLNELCIQRCYFCSM